MHIYNVLSFLFGSRHRPFLRSEVRSKKSEVWAALHRSHCNHSTILTIIGRYIGVIPLDKKHCFFFMSPICLVFQNLLIFFPVSWDIVKSWRVSKKFPIRWFTACNFDVGGAGCWRSTPMWLVWSAELLLLCAACVAFASAAAVVYKLIDGLLTTEEDIVQYIVQHTS